MPARLRSAICCGVVAASLCAVFCRSSFAQDGNGDFVLQYRPNDGNLTLVFTGTGLSGAGPVSLSMLNILTLGDGNFPSAYGPAMPAGIPNVVVNQGGLNGARAALPPASLQTFNSGAGATAGLNGVYSEIYNASIGSTWMTFTSGGATALDLGSVAAAGWSQGNIDSIFVTNADVSPNAALNFGRFLYAELDGGSKLGRIEVLAVPEPVAVGVVGLVTVLLTPCRVHRRTP